MTALPPCACGHLHCLHIPAAASAGRCTGAGCDCRGYVRRTTLPDEHLTPAAGDWNPTDDELRAIARPGIDELDLTCDLARLVLREREELRASEEWRRVTALERDYEVERRKQAEAERDRLRELIGRACDNADDYKRAADQARAALARTEAFAAKHRATDFGHEPWWVTELCAAIAGDPPAACSVAEHMDAATSAVPCICQRVDTPPAAGYGADMGTNGPAGDTPRAGETTGTYVVDFEPGLYGPFPSRVAANAWAGRPINDGVIRSWTVRPVLAPAEVPHAAPSAPTHLPLDEVIEIAADLARRAATPPGTDHG